MKQRSLFFFTLLILGLLSACSRPADDSTPTLDANQRVTSVVETAYAQITETAQAAEIAATSTPTPEPTLTPTVVEPTATPTDTPAPTEEGLVPTEVLLPTAVSGENIPCLRANLEYESVPDGTVYKAERKFTKVWRLKNTGSCTWDKDFSLRFIQGDLIGAGASVPLTAVDIPTWDYATVEVSMKAPAKPGSYQGYWMITSSDGKIFGIGPEGKGWFWIKIEVIPAN